MPGWLRGANQTVIGEIGTHAGDACAIALSRGGSEKTYSHVDLNEDGAVAAEGPGGQLVAVADGHAGADAADVALEHVVAHLAPRLVASDTTLHGVWREVALDLLVELNATILARREARGGRRARTTFALAVTRHAEGRLYFVSMGDSHVYLDRDDEAHDLAFELSPGGDPFFLGAQPETRETLAEKCVIGSERLAGARAVVVATDGLSERGIGVDDPDAAVHEAAIAATTAESGEPRALVCARGLLEIALAAHGRRRAGDNVAAGVIWLAG